MAIHLQLFFLVLIPCGKTLRMVWGLVTYVLHWLLHSPRSVNCAVSKNKREQKDCVLFHQTNAELLRSELQKHSWCVTKPIRHAQETRIYTHTKQTREIIQRKIQKKWDLDNYPRWRSSGSLVAMISLDHFWEQCSHAHTNVHWSALLVHLHTPSYWHWYWFTQRSYNLSFRLQMLRQNRMMRQVARKK